MDGDEFLCWVEASCRASGVPVRVADARVVRDVAVLLTGAVGVPVAGAVEGGGRDG